MPEASLGRRAIPINPVLGRELVERMRGARAMVTVTIYLAVLTIIVALVYESETSESFGAPVVTRVANIGQGLFEWVLIFMVLLVLFLVPGFTSGAIAGERERQTLLPLQVTLLRPISILLGKVASSLVFTVLLVIASVPMLAVGYLVGGVTVGEIAKGVGFILFVALALACITVTCSTFAKRVQTATVMAYGIVLLLAGGTIVAFLVARQVDSSQGFDTVDPPHTIVAPNPLAALATLVGEDPFLQAFSPFGYSDSDAPLSGLRDLLEPDVFAERDFAEAAAVAIEAPAAPAVLLDRQAVRFDAFGNPVPVDADRSLLPLWAQSMLMLGGAGALGLLASARRLRTPAATER